jgi:xanthine dehydrogenase accessory factor
MNGPGVHPALRTGAALVAADTPRGALVTLVRADGGTSKILGTQLGLAEDGRTFGSVTIGGCADGRAAAAAREALRRGTRELLALPISEADALALGLGCAGDIELVVEPMSLGADDPLPIALAAARSSAGARAALVTPLDGAIGRLLVRADGSVAGTLGTSARDAAAATRVADRLADASMESGVTAWEAERWFVHLLTPVATLIVVGATDVAAAVCTLAVPLGWRTVLIDARYDLLAEPRFAAASERTAGMPAESVAALLGAGAEAVVLLAHDYRVEAPVLRIALRSGASYVGMLGSRKRAAVVSELLAAEGFTVEELARLRAPVGLRIGAQGPLEIAVSIVAEVISTLRRATPSEAAP